MIVTYERKYGAFELLSIGKNGFVMCYGTIETFEFNCVDFIVLTISARGGEKKPFCVVHGVLDIEDERRAVINAAQRFYRTWQNYIADAELLDIDLDERAEA